MCLLTRLNTLLLLAAVVAVVGTRVAGVAQADLELTLDLLLPQTLHIP
jgi:hypothetical protein